MAYEGNNLAFGNMNAELQEMIEQGGLYENIVPLEATNAPADYPLGESFFANTSPNIASWQTALGVDASFTRLFVITRIDKDRLHALQDILIASGTETKRFTRYNLNENWLAARESGGSAAKPYGVEVINENHAIRRFPIYNGWTNNINGEILYYVFNIPKEQITGDFKVRVATADNANGVGGQAEVSFQARGNDVNVSFNVIDVNVHTISPSVRDRLLIGAGIGVSTNSDNLPYYPITKRDKSVPMYVEIEVLNAMGNAASMLESIYLKLNSTSYTAPMLTNIQYSTISKLSNPVNASISNITYYVDSVNGNDETGVPSNPQQKYKTISYVLGLIPKVLNDAVTIFLEDGNHGDILMYSYTGGGTVTIRSNVGSLASSVNCKVSRIQALGCTAAIRMYGLSITTTNNHSLLFDRCSHVHIGGCRLEASATGYAGILGQSSIIYVYDSIVSNKGQAIYGGNAARILTQQCQGSGNATVYYSSYGSELVRVGTAPTGTTMDTTLIGGIIRTA